MEKPKRKRKPMVIPYVPIAWDAPPEVKQAAFEEAMARVRMLGLVR